ncbi:MAG: LptA/OstA family protein [Breznakiellaceae bacterium]
MPGENAVRSDRFSLWDRALFLEGSAMKAGITLFFLRSRIGARKKRGTGSVRIPFVVRFRGALALLLLVGASASFAEVFQFKADGMIGSRATGSEQIILSGNARVWSSSLLLEADRIVISGKNNRYLQCSGNVKGTDTKKGIYFTTSSLWYDREQKIARMEGESYLEDKDNGVIIKAHFIQYDDTAERAMLQVGVRIFKDTLVCRAEYALYQKKEKRLELQGSPVVFKEGDELRARRMWVNLDNNDVVMEGSVSGTIREKQGTSKK